jgi:hypothetical protein
MLFQKYMNRYGVTKTAKPRPLATSLSPDYPDLSLQEQIESQLSKNCFKMENISPDGKTHHRNIDTSENYNILTTTKFNSKKQSVDSNFNIIDATDTKSRLSKNSKMFVIKIEIAPRTTRLLRFSEIGNPMTVAQNFCFQNSLDDSAIDALAKFIHDFRGLDLGMIFASKQWKLRD